jgi:hypothetical protein
MKPTLKLVNRGCGFTSQKHNKSQWHQGKFTGSRDFTRLYRKEQSGWHKSEALAPIPARLRLWIPSFRSQIAVGSAPSACVYEQKLIDMFNVSK